MKFTKLFLISCLVLFLFGYLAFLFDQSTKVVGSESRSVTQIGLNLGNSFSAPSTFLKTHSHFGLQPEKIPAEFLSAVNRMPLVIDRKDLSRKINRRLKGWPEVFVTFISNNKKLIFFDLKKMRSFKTLTLPPWFHGASNSFFLLDRAILFWQTSRALFSYKLGDEKVN